jgi:hypothetical protein
LVSPKFSLAKGGQEGTIGFFKSPFSKGGLAATSLGLAPMGRGGEEPIKILAHGFFPKI